MLVGEIANVTKYIYLYFAKNLGFSKSNFQLERPIIISSVNFKPSLNFCINIFNVALETLNVEFCCGYDGVIIGIRCSLSFSFIYND